jgi:Zn-dependent M28 family amino/carboxypeptidase
MIRVVRLLLLAALLFSAFLLYSVMKVKETSSVFIPLAPQIRGSSLFEHVEQLSVKIGSRSVFEYENLTAAKEYILSRLRGIGYAPELQNFSYQDRIFSNVVLTLPGKTQPEKIVLIGAHYDTVAGTPGADDNASAVAILLEMSRLLKDYSPDTTLRLVFFTLEEPPIFRTEFMGSAIHAQGALNKKENIIAMLSLEMLGYYSDQERGQSFPFPFMSLMYSTTPDFIAVVGNLSSRRLVKQVENSIRKSGGIPVETLTTFSLVPGVDFSDHNSFWKRGYTAVMITDTAFYRNPNYHSPDDRIETLDFHKMSALLEALVQTAKDLTSG